MIKPPHFRHLLAASISAVAVIAVIIAGTLILSGPARDPATARLTKAIDEETASLDLKPRTVELISEKALRARHAIQQGDYKTAQGIVTAALGESRIENWRFYPFGDFINQVSDVNDPSFQSRLDDWVANAPDDALPVLLRAQYFLDAGWFKRGHDFIKNVEEDHRTAFQSYMDKALVDGDRAISLDPGNPYAFYLKLRILQGLGVSKRLKDAFDATIAKFPGYYPAYDLVLRTLEPKWGGSVPMMIFFVDKYAGEAPEYSPLKLLYVSLYRDLLDTASVACHDASRDHDKLAACVAEMMQKVDTPRLENTVEAALNLYDHTDDLEFGAAIEYILVDMLNTAGADAYSGAMLQFAATAMHSDTQLKEDKPGGNDFIIDKATSVSWYNKGDYDAALKKAQEALQDAKRATFPSEAEKDATIGWIYSQLAADYDKLNQYQDIIVYENASLSLGGPNSIEHFVCYGYYRLKDNPDAIRACTQTIADKPDNMYARYWRGMAYRDSGQPDAALADLAIVANSENNFRASAAITMSLIHFDRNDNRGALDILNRYTYLYDRNTQSKATLASSYNNRCYAYMQLGDLQKALTECTASLQYGSLPDAYRKQQELIRRLSGRETGL